MALNKADFNALREDDLIRGVGLLGAIVTYREGETVTIQLITGTMDCPSSVCVWSDYKNLITKEDGSDLPTNLKRLNSSAFTMKENGPTLATRWLEDGIINQEQYGRLMNAIAASVQEEQDRYLPPGW